MASLDGVFVGGGSLVVLLCFLFSFLRFPCVMAYSLCLIFNVGLDHGGVVGLRVGWRCI